MLSGSPVDGEDDVVGKKPGDGRSPSWFHKIHDEILGDIGAKLDAIAVCTNGAPMFCVSVPPQYAEFHVVGVTLRTKSISTLE